MAIIQVDSTALVAGLGAFGAAVGTGIKLGLNALARALDRSSAVSLQMMRALGVVETTGVAEVIEQERSGVTHVPEAELTPAMKAAGYRPRAKSEPGRVR